LRQRIAQRIGFPLPIQLVVVLLGALLSNQCDLNQRYKVDIVGEIPVGFPKISLPLGTPSLSLLLDALILAVVGFCISLAMAKALASSTKQNVNSSRELAVDGLSNVFGSFFQCIPQTTSMSRTFVQVQVNGRTQMTGIVSALILLLISTTVGKIFEPLPKTILAAIILSCLKGMFKQLGGFRRFYKNSKLDGILWLGIFGGVILTSADLGMAIGIGLNIFAMAYRAYDVTLEVTHCPLLRGSIAIKISGILIFANVDKAKRLIAKTRNAVKNVSHVVLDLNHVQYVDQLAAQSLATLLDETSIVNGVECRCHVICQNAGVVEMLATHYKDGMSWEVVNNAKEIDTSSNQV